MVNTRFNPTANGNLHIGHLYLILLNYNHAKKTDGKFIVRFDDDQYYWVNNLGKEKVNQFCEEIKKDLAWIGIIPDVYSYESKEREENQKPHKNL
jgi:glutamyl/glutaminyl-tRNA synthetase